MRRLTIAIAVVLSVFNAVTCCSGCFSAYRREAILPHLEAWEHQRFLGQESTFGDDRSLSSESQTAAVDRRLGSLALRWGRPASPPGCRSRRNRARRA